MRIEDRYPFFRNQRAAILRVGTIAALNADRTRADVTVPGGTLTGVPVLKVSGLVVGATVNVLLDRDAAVVIGATGAALPTWVRFSHDATVVPADTPLNVGVSNFYMTWAANAFTAPAPVVVRAGSATWLDVVQPGSYRFTLWQRLAIAVPNGAGYFQAHFEGTGITLQTPDALVSIGGSIWIDLNHTQTFVAAPGAMFRVRFNNASNQQLKLWGTYAEWQHLG